MRRIGNRKSRLGFFAQVYDKNGEVVQRVEKRTKKGFLVLLRGELAKKWHKIYIRVTYGRSHWNDSEHYNLHSLEKALDAYTDKQLLDFVERTEG